MNKMVYYNVFLPQDDQSTVRPICKCQKWDSGKMPESYTWWKYQGVCLAHRMAMSEWQCQNGNVC